MDQNISIDIHIPKLLEWLVSRRHCTNDWQKDIAKIRMKINSAIQDMPENKEIASLLAGSYINYYNSLKIVEILKETEKDSKNIFGLYSSQRMKDWNEVVSLYKKNNVYLAEAAELLINIVKYEVPSLKKQIHKQQQLQQEFKKKEVDAVKSGATAKNELTVLLKELGISGVSTGFKKALIENAKSLTDTHENVAKKCKSILPSIEHYSSFASFSQPNSDIDMKLILHLAEKGNTTTFEWLHGKAPDRVVVQSINTEDEAADDDYDTIDWGDTDIQIDIVDSGSAEKNESTEIEQESKDPNEIVAEGVEALTILDNSATRANFINQLLELQAFLKIRLLDSDTEGTFEGVAESKQSVENMLKSVENILSLLNNPTVQHQYNITFSPRYLDDIIKKIEQKQSSIERAGAVIDMSKESAEEATKEVSALTTKMHMIIKRSKELQDEISKDISNKYNGRKVFLMGAATAN